MFKMLRMLIATGEAYHAVPIDAVYKIPLTRHVICVHSICERCLAYGKCSDTIDIPELELRCT